MKIMTFNTQHCQNFISKRIDYEAVADLIKTYDPDIVGLNEIRGKGHAEGFEAQTEILSSLTGLPYHYFAKAIDCGDGNPYGNAVLSKMPLLSAEVIPIRVPDECRFTDRYYEDRCILKVKLENSYTVLITHFGLNPDEQEYALQVILENTLNEKCILMGDFNVTPDSYIIKSIRERMTDTAEMFIKPLLSFPSDAPERKIDYIFVSRDITLLSADIPDIIVSDHRPHTAEIML